jgi:UDP-GlcNAc:undecaprenyl-phosphate GlcNAc-1-phosphate transferase
MDYQRLILSCLAGAGVSVAVIALILRMQGRMDILRRDAEFHHKIGGKSRLGGVAIVAAFASVVLLFKALNIWNPEPIGPYPCRKMAAVALAMFGLGFWDDLSPLGAKRKLVGQVVIAAAACWLGIEISQFQLPFGGRVIELGFWAWPVTVFWLVAMTNLINLIDGVDGLAGGICLMLMILLTYVGAGVGAMSFFGAGMVGALMGFLWFNFPPARIYMGDGGAYFLGFLIGCMTIVSSQKGTIFAALTAPLFVLALPILDTSLAIVRRGTQGLPLFRPDRGHIHHRLLETGLSRRTMVVWIYGFTAIFLALGFVAFWWHGQHLAELFGAGMVIILLLAGQFNFSREWFAVGRTLGNSLTLRSEIQYALAQTRWLALEGTRSNNLEDLCEDTVFIARKLGFAGVHVQLEDRGKTWQLLPADDNHDCRFHHTLPGHPGCYLELAALCPQAGARRSPLPAASPLGSCVMGCSKSSRITAELLAEGWVKAVAAWKKHNRLPVRFDARTTQSAEPQHKAIPGIQPAATPLSQ